MNTTLWITPMLAVLLLIGGCTNGNEIADAYGNFEVDEITVSSKTQGELLSWNVEEGMELDSAAIVGVIDTVSLHLQRAELKANMLSASAQRKSVEAQIDVRNNELKKLENDLVRIKKLYDQHAATQKQYDDISSAVETTRKSLAVLQAQYPAIKAQEEAVEAKGALLDQRLSDAVVVNPVGGVVLNRFVLEHEIVAPGKPLYTIANIDHLFLRAYITGEQLSEVSVGSKVSVFTDASNGEMTEHKGTVTWVSSKAEFTPKSVQTKEERVAQVYAIKVRVPGDGSIKIGMPGEVRWTQQ